MVRETRKLEDRILEEGEYFDSFLAKAISAAPPAELEEAWR